jgi:hypothetical protein
MQANNVIQLPLVPNPESVEGFWLKVYMVLTKMVADPETKVKVRSNEIQFFLNGLRVDLRKFHIYVKNEGSEMLSVPNPSCMQAAFGQAIQDANKGSIEDIFDDFLGL